MIIKKYKDDKLYLEINNFKVDDGFEHLFSTRIGWNQNDLSTDLAEILDVGVSQIYTTRQVHGVAVEVIRDQDSKDISKEPRDGLITNRKDVVLATYHADCVPIYFYDKVQKVVGMAHSGWKGSLNNISGEMISLFKSEFSSNLDDIIVAIGPSICASCYEIKGDLELLFREKFEDVDDIIINKDKKMYLDLWKVNKYNLLNIGIKDDNIIESNFCTSCNLDYLYSYRKENTKSRMIGVIKLT